MTCYLKMNVKLLVQHLLGWDELRYNCVLSGVYLDSSAKLHAVHFITLSLESRVQSHHPDNHI